MSTANKFCLACLLTILATIALARSEGIYNPSSNSVGDYQGIDSNAAVAQGLVGKLLMVDGISHVLQTDAVSRICLAGGC
jgi:hypothetical protein